MAIKSLHLIFSIFIASTLILENVVASDVANVTRNAVDSIFKVMEIGVFYLITKLTSFILTLMRITYFVVGLIGVLLWGSGFSGYRGRNMIVSAIIMAVISEVAATILH